MFKVLTYLEHNKLDNFAVPPPLNTHPFIISIHTYQFFAQRLKSTICKFFAPRPIFIQPCPTIFLQLWFGWKSKHFDWLDWYPLKRDLNPTEHAFVYVKYGFMLVKNALRRSENFWIKAKLFSLSDRFSYDWKFEHTGIEFQNCTMIHLTIRNDMEVSQFYNY